MEQVSLTCLGSSGVNGVKKQVGRFVETNERTVVVRLIYRKKLPTNGQRLIGI